MQRISISFALASVMLVSALAFPSAVALACTIEFRRFDVQLARTEIRRPAERVTSRSAWRIDEEWIGTTPQLNQVVKIRGVGVSLGVAFAQQRALSIDAAAPSNNGWTYRDDDYVSTPPCEIAGQAEWQRPVIMVRENEREVRVAAVARRTPGSRVGCVLGGEDATWGCPTLTRTVKLLAKPIGERKLVFEQVGG